MNSLCFRNPEAIIRVSTYFPYLKVRLSMTLHHKTKPNGHDCTCKSKGYSKASRQRNREGGLISKRKC